MKKKKKYLSIILIPDEGSNPHSIKIRYIYLKILLAFFIIIGCFVILAGKSYWKMAEILFDYNYLKEQNLKLERDNIKINRIIKEFNDLKRNDDRIKELLGITFPLPEKNPEKGLQTTASIKSQIENRDENINYINKIPYEVPSTYSGDFLKNYSYIPSLLPVRGYITKRYLSGKDAKGRIHYGIDIAAKLKSIIRASASGIVIFSNWTYEYGNSIIIDHLNGYLTFYKHNHKLLVSEGEFVTQGMAIALLGNSGESSAPHLHFEIWKNGKPVNPEKLILNLN